MMRNFFKKIFIFFLVLGLLYFIYSKNSLGLGYPEYKPCTVNGVSVTSECNFHYQECNGSCNAYCILTGNSCPRGWGPVCGYNPEGRYEGSGVFNYCDICSCVKGLEPPPSSGLCKCIKDNGLDRYVVDPNNNDCKPGEKPLCHGTGYTYEINGGDCTCLGESEVNEYESAQSVLYNNDFCRTSEGYLGVETTLGCVPTDIKRFTTWVMKYIFGIAGGIAFLLMVYGFILMATSKGDEKKLQGAKETVTSAIIGLLVSIFALFIFRLIAVDILHIPGIN